MMFVRNGIWDPYGYIHTNFSHFPYTYYAPALFIIMSFLNLLMIKFFNPLSLIKILELSSAMMFKNFGTVDYVRALSHHELIKNLFLMKTPYLIFDFLTAALLLKLAFSKDEAWKSYKLWIFNIVVLHSAYAVGQFDLITAFFITAGLFAALKKRPYMCIVSLSLGGATKLFPYILVLPAAFLLGNTWKTRFSLLLTAAMTSFVLYIPFYLSSGTVVFGSFTLGRYYEGVTRWIFAAIFVVLYALLSIAALKDSKNPYCEKKLIFYFLTLGFLTYAVSPISFRYFTFVTPLLVLIIPRHKSFGIFILFIILMLAFVRLPDRDLQLGMFAPINPDYFASLPTIQEVIGRHFDIGAIYKILSRMLLMSFFIAAWWIWRIKVKYEKRGYG